MPACVANGDLHTSAIAEERCAGDAVPLVLMLEAIKPP